MGRRKRYEPCCPSETCTANGSYLYQVKEPGSVQLSEKVLERREPGYLIYRCRYCGFVWFQSSVCRPGFDPVPAGYYDSLGKLNVFLPVPVTYPIKEQNTQRYWDEYNNRLDRQHD